MLLSRTQWAAGAIAGAGNFVDAAAKCISLDHFIGGPCTIGAMFLVGTGPSELRAHLDLFHRACDTDEAGDVVLISTTHDAGHWSVVAELQSADVGEGQ